MRLIEQTRPLDAAIGGRIRAGRLMRGISQEKLGEALGVTFQQVQKYEKGTNRVAVSTLLRIAEALGMAPCDLVPELMGTGGEAPAPTIRDPRALEAAQLVAALRIPRHRHLVLQMVRTFVELTVEPLTGAGEAQAA